MAEGLDPNAEPARSFKVREKRLRYLTDIGAKKQAAEAQKTLAPASAKGKGRRPEAAPSATADTAPTQLQPRPSAIRRELGIIETEGDQKRVQDRAERFDQRAETRGPLTQAQVDEAQRTNEIHDARETVMGPLIAQARQRLRMTGPRKRELAQRQAELAQHQTEFDQRAEIRGDATPEMIGRARVISNLDVRPAKESPEQLQKLRAEYQARGDAATRGELTDDKLETAYLVNEARDRNGTGLRGAIARRREQLQSSASERAERKQLVEEYQERSEKRGELSGEDLADAYASNEANTLAATALKNGRIEEARQSLELAHQRSLEKVTEYRENRQASGERVDELINNIPGLLEGKFAPDAAAGDEVDDPESDALLTDFAHKIDLQLFEDSPDLNVKMLHQLRERLGADTPLEKRRVDEAEQPGDLPVNELIYASNVSPNLVYAERWSQDGQLVSARLLAMAEPAFERRRRGLRSKSLRPSEETLLALDDAGVADAMPNYADRSTTDKLTPLMTKISGKYQPARDQLRAEGMDEASINRITGRRGPSAAKRRRWTSMFRR